MNNSFFKVSVLFGLISTCIAAFLLMTALTNMHQATINPPCPDGLTLACGAEYAKTPRITTLDYYTYSSVILGYAFITIFLCIASLRMLSKNPQTKSKTAIIIQNLAFVLGIPGYFVALWLFIVIVGFLADAVSMPFLYVFPLVLLVLYVLVRVMHELMSSRKRKSS